MHQQAIQALRAAADLAEDEDLSPIWGGLRSNVNASCVVDGDWDEIQDYADKELDLQDSSRCALGWGGCGCKTGVIEVYARMRGLVVLAVRPDSFHEVFKHRGDPKLWKKEAMEITGISEGMHEALFEPERIWNAWIPKRHVAETLREVAEALEQGVIHDDESCRTFMRTKLDAIKASSPKDMDNGHVPDPPGRLRAKLIETFGRGKIVTLRKDKDGEFTWSTLENIRSILCQFLVRVLDPKDWWSFHQGHAIRKEYRPS